MSSPMIVEFVGMMGSGKSTIAHLVIRELNRRGYRCPSQEVTAHWMAESGFCNEPVLPTKLAQLRYRSKLAYFIAAFQFPLLAFKSYRYALSVLPQNRSSWQESRNSMTWMGILNKYVQTSSYDVVVFEEAAIQYSNIVPLSGKHYSRNAQKALISSLIAKEKHLVIYTKINAKTVMERIRERAAASHAQGFLSWRFENETEDFQLRKATQAIDIFESTAKHLKRLIPSSFIELDCCKEPKHNADIVVDFIETQFFGRKTRTTKELVKLR
jgi:thymidylate kinase